MSDPRVTLDKKEVIEGGVVMVNCSVPEEKAPIHFTIEKFELNVKGVKQKREKTSQNQNFVTLKFTVEEQDHAIWFQCQARIVSGTHVEPSRSIRSELVTVRGQSPTLLFIILSGLLVWSGEEEPRIGKGLGPSGWTAVSRLFLITLCFSNFLTVTQLKIYIYIYISQQHLTLIYDAFCYFSFYSLSVF